MARKRRKLDSDKPLPIEHSEVPGGEAAWNNSTSLGELHSSVGPQVFAVEVVAPTSKEVPLVLVAKQQAPTWAHHIATTSKLENLPKEQEKMKE